MTKRGANLIAPGLWEGSGCGRSTFHASPHTLQIRSTSRALTPMMFPYGGARGAEDLVGAEYGCV